MCASGVAARISQERTQAVAAPGMACSTAGGIVVLCCAVLCPPRLPTLSRSPSAEQEHADELALLETLDNGKTFTQASAPGCSACMMVVVLPGFGQSEQSC